MPSDGFQTIPSECIILFYVIFEKRKYDYILE